MIPPKHTKIIDCKAIPDLGIQVVFEDYYHYPKGESNLYAINEKNEIVWEAKKLSPQDVFVGNPTSGMSLGHHAVERDGHIVWIRTVSAHTWEGFHCLYDVRTGELVFAEFTK